jgi:hypothetical protein
MTTSALRRTGILALCLASGVHAQAMRRLTLAQDLRLGALQLGGQRDMLVSVAPNGQLVVVPRFGGMSIIAFDSLGNQLPWKIAIGGRNDSEILVPGRVGWIAGTQTMWVADQGYRQVVLVDSTGKVFKSIENPSWIHPSWAERRKYPVFASMQAFAVYKDETMLLLPGRERALLDTPGYDRSGEHLLRASWSGSIQRTVAMLPDQSDRVILQSKGCQHAVTIPFGPRAIWAVSPDGMRVVVASSGASVADSGTVRLTAIGERGDTIFSRTIPQPAVRVPQATIDNLLANQRACGGFTAEAVRDSISRRLTTFRSFVEGVLPGRDRTTWVTLHAVSDTSMERTAIGLDERGEIIGVVALPVNEILVAADRGHLWTTQTPRQRQPAVIVRYRLDVTPAPPPRSGRGGGPPNTPRPRE